jgi:hypothetical protein
MNHLSCSAAIIAVVANDAIDEDFLKTDMEQALRSPGMHQPVIIKIVDAVVRRQETGKLRRFIPLPSS